uniref:Minor glycoprotein n=1 Tax=Kibale red colobus virus 1 TaxID=1885929 RepID=F5BD14_9NIDO|nr:minor glycoprotein [Kibale red colobus virus 1]AHH53532.1 minor glycoprotein [Kibale red colobus virus 1]
MSLQLGSHCFRGSLLWLLFLSSASPYSLFTHFVQRYYKPANEKELHYLFTSLVDHCKSNLAPWVNHPLGIIDAGGFHRAYTDWISRIYSPNEMIGIGQPGWTHYYTSGHCAHPHLDVEKKEVISLENTLVGAFRTYSIMELNMCQDLARILPSIYRNFRADFNNFTITNDTYTVNMYLGPNHKVWLASYSIQAYHASAFSVVIAPLTLTIILLIRHPSLFAFTCLPATRSRS